MCHHQCACSKCTYVTYIFICTVRVVYIYIYDFIYMIYPGRVSGNSPPNHCNTLQQSCNTLQQPRTYIWLYIYDIPLLTLYILYILYDVSYIMYIDIWLLTLDILYILYDVSYIMYIDIWLLTLYILYILYDVSYIMHIHIWSFDRLISVVALCAPYIYIPTATHCNTLQHTATHCNTLQHTPCTLSSWYGVATISRLLKIIGLFCRISSVF